MLRRMVICLIIVGAGALFAASSSARERRHIDVTPFSHAPCSVLSGECTPSTCSVFNHGPCIPEFYVRYKANYRRLWRLVHGSSAADVGACRRHRRALLMCSNAPASSLPSMKSAT
jgi:hypothetical protein